MFKITDLPPQILHDINKKKDPSDLKAMQFSENMIVYTGRKGLHIFDIDRERWVFNSTKSGYNYEEIYHAARDINSDEEGFYSSNSGTNESGEEEDEDLEDDQIETSSNNDNSSPNGSDNMPALFDQFEALQIERGAGQQSVPQQEEEQKVESNTAS